MAKKKDDTTPPPPDAVVDDTGKARRAPTPAELAARERMKAGRLAAIAARRAARESKGADEAKPDAPSLTALPGGKRDLGLLDAAALVVAVVAVGAFLSSSRAPRLAVVSGGVR